MTNLMPVIFVGHGNPMNALARNAWTDGWASIGKSIPRPQAVLSVSAHWYVSSTAVTAGRAPKTIHDFGGFPQELYDIEYPAPGSPKLARRVSDLLGPVSAGLDKRWGLDHGTWAVLCHVFPKADVPVVQLSIDRRQPPEFHYEIGKRLAPLRDQVISRNFSCSKRSWSKANFMERGFGIWIPPGKHYGRPRAALDSSATKIQYVMNIRHNDDNSRPLRRSGAMAHERSNRV